MMDEPIQATDLDTRKLLLSNVAEIAPVLRGQVEDEEEAAQFSRASSDALRDAGVLKMKLPRSLGGFEADLVTQFEVLEALSMISPAAGWCAMVGATSLAMPGAFLPQGGIDRMFAGGVVPRGAILIMPTGKASRTEGGFRLTGRWSFASGVHHAEWVSARGLLYGTSDGPPILHMFTFPASEIEIHDNWDVMGLRGTGSCDISVDDIFVPEDCAWNVETQPPRRGGPLYQLGVPSFVAYEHAAFATGVARHALNLLTERAIDKKRGYGPDAGTLADRQVVQRFIGHSDLKLRAARGLAVELNRRAMELARNGEGMTAQQAIELRGIACYCTEVAIEIVGQAFRYSGANSIFAKNSMQRFLRDLNAAGQHLMVSEISYELLGKTHLGFPDVPPMG
jgi:alkylation response protein AidB-like acyl-CoA dehydrogenase